MAQHRIIIVVPAFNEAATIQAVVAAVARYGTPLVVDDGSGDGTGDLAADAGAQVLRMAANRGYEGALNAGFAEADRLGADFVVTFDADGQFDAALLAEMLAPLLAGTADMVLGVRPRAARISEAVFGLYTRLRYGVGDILCGVKGYRMDVYRRHGRFGDGRSVGTELALAALRGGARTTTVPAAARPREDHASRFGRGWRANRRIMVAMRLAIESDLKHLVAS